MYINKKRIMNRREQKKYINRKQTEEDKNEKKTKIYITMNKYYITIIAIYTGF